MRGTCWVFYPLTWVIILLKVLTYSGNAAILALYSTGSHSPRELSGNRSVTGPDVVLIQWVLNTLVDFTD